MNRTLWTCRFSFLVWLALIVFQASGGSQSSRNPIDPDNTTPDTSLTHRDVEPAFVLKAVPVYPQAALDYCLEGVVWVSLLVDTVGVVIDVKVVKDSGSNAGFEEASIEAAWRCEFSPAISNGEPVAVWASFPFRFRLREDCVPVG